MRMYLRSPLYSRIGIFILATALGAGAYMHAFADPSEADTIARGVVSFEELDGRFKTLAEEKGAAYAFDILRQAPLPPNTDLHLLGHTVGDALYQQEGVSGMARCTQDFRNACSHSVVIGAMNEYGDMGALPLIQEACQSAPGGSGAYTMCYHGLGHGVFAYYGYDLEDTVAFCKKTGTSEHVMQEYTQCVGGAIMELMGGGGHARSLWLAAREKYLTNDPLSPCDKAIIPDVAKVMCYIYLTPHLLERAGTVGGNPKAIYFAKAFRYCDAIPTLNQEFRDACYGGFGKEFIPLANNHDVRTIDTMTNAQYSTAIAWCGYAGPEDGKKSCIQSELASIFWGGEGDLDSAFRFCGLVVGTLQDACYGELADEIRIYLAQTASATLCARLPQEFIARCETKKS